MQHRSLDKGLAQIVEESAITNLEFSQLASSVMAGIEPSKEKSRRVGTEMKRHGMKLRGLLDELETSKDFQAMEAYQTLEAMARRANLPGYRAVEQLMNWQGDGLIASADGRPPPPMPRGLDPGILSSTPGAITPADASPANRPTIDLGIGRFLPFSEAEFEAVETEESAALKAEFERLCRDHEQLVGLGETYGDFDPAGKEYYLGQMAQTAFRWEALMDDAQMAGISISPAFRDMSETYLGRSRLSPDDFRTILEEVHDFFQMQVDMEKGVGA